VNGALSNGGDTAPVPDGTGALFAFDDHAKLNQLTST
jgi:hypothetical protein